jgi:hypothetical protein
MNTPFAWPNMAATHALWLRRLADPVLRQFLLKDRLSARPIYKKHKFLKINALG